MSIETGQFMQFREEISVEIQVNRSLGVPSIVICGTSASSNLKILVGIAGNSHTPSKPLITPMTRIRFRITTAASGQENREEH
jgi:hypothetical protein